MKVKNLIELLQHEDQESQIIFTSPDGDETTFEIAGFVSAAYPGNPAGKVILTDKEGKFPNAE